MSTPIAFPGNAVTASPLPDGVVPGTRKRKQAFSLNDPDNVEIQRIAIQAAKKKARLSKLPSEKEKTDHTPPLHQKKTHGKPANRQASVEEVDDPDNHPKRVFPRNPRNIIESDEDNDEAGKVQVDHANEEDKEDESEVEVVEQPAESAEAELSQ